MAESVEPGTYHLKIFQGADLDRTFTYKDENGALVNLTGFTARAQVRTSLEGDQVLLDMTDANGRIVLGGANGTIQLLVTAAITTALTARKGVWDLELIDGSGVVTRLLQGQATIFGEATL